MSSNIPLMNSTKDKNEDQEMAQNKVPSLDKSGSDSKTVIEQTEKLDKNQDQEMAQNKVTSLDKSGSAQKNVTEQTEKLDNKKRSVQLSSSDDKKMAGLDPKDMRIKIHKSAHDDKIYSSMYVSLDIVHIPMKKQKKKVSETSITGNKVTQDQDDRNK